MVLCLLLSSPARAVEAGAASAPFLLTDFGARAASMGGAATGAPLGHDALYYNPAGLGFLPQKELALQHIEDISGDNYEEISYVHPVKDRWGIGVSTLFVYFTDAIRSEFETLQEFTNYDLSIGLSLGYRVTSNLAVGGSAKFIKERLINFDATTEAYDLGIFYKTPLPGFSIGYARKDIGRGLKFISTRDPLPTSDRIGISYRRPGRSWGVVADAVHISDQKLRLGYGVEHDIGEYLTLRAGWRHNYDGRSAAGPTGGLSIRYGNIAFDYAWVPVQGFLEVGATHRIQSVIAFGAIRGRPDDPVHPASSARDAQASLRLFSGFRGSWTAGNQYTVIDNREIINHVRGFRPSFDYYAAGRIGAAEATVGMQMYYDTWDRYRLRRATVALRSAELRMTAGHFIAQMTPYTVTGRELLGGEASFTHARHPAEIVAPSGRALRGDGERPLNIGRYLRQNGFGRDAFAATTVRALAGQSARALNVGDRVPELNAIRATFGVYEQYTYAAEVTTEPVRGTTLGVRVVHVSDDEQSLHTPGITTPLSNTVLAATGGYRFPSGKLVGDAEIAYSIFDRNTVSSIEKAKNDVSWFTRGIWKPGAWRFEGVFEQIGPEFDLGGNLSIRSFQDRRGPRVTIEGPVIKGVNLRMDGNSYEDNLDNRKPFTTLTLDGGTELSFDLPQGIYFNVGYRDRTDRSERAKDTEPFLQRINTENRTLRGFLRIPIRSWTLTMNASSSVNDNRSELTVGSISGSKLLNYGLSLLGPLTSRADFSGGYNMNRTEFTLNSQRTLSEQIYGRINIRQVFSKADVYLTTRYNRTQGQTQKEIRAEYGVGTRFALAADKQIVLDYKRITDNFTPTQNRLEYKSHVLDAKYTSLF